MTRSNQKYSDYQWSCLQTLAGKAVTEYWRGLWLYSWATQARDKSMFCCQTNLSNIDQNRQQSSSWGFLGSIENSVSCFFHFLLMELNFDLPCFALHATTLAAATTDRIDDFLNFFCQVANFLTIEKCLARLDCYLKPQKVIKLWLNKNGKADNDKLFLQWN